MKIWGKTEIVGFVRRLIEENPDNLNNPDKYIKHVLASYDIAQEVIRRITHRYSRIKLIEYEVCLASGLHDIGRPLKKDQSFHELRGAAFIENRGLELGIAESLTDVFRIAQMFRPHGAVYELWNTLRIEDEFEITDSSLLLPRTWQEAIVDYSDLNNLDGERMNFKEKLALVPLKYRKQGYASKEVLNATESSIGRMLLLCDRVEALMNGKLTEQEISRFGFN